MDIKQLIEKMDQFAGEKVGQKPGDQFKGSDAAPAGKKLVGDSMLKDLSKGKTPKSKEQELAEEFQAFSEAEFKDTVDKRPSRKVHVIVVDMNLNQVIKLSKQMKAE